MVADTGISVNEHAARLLRKNGITVMRIIRVTPDSILYLGASERPMTAWLAKNENEDKDDRITIAYESGFPAYPTSGVSPRHVLSRDAALDDLKETQ